MNIPVRQRAVALAILTLAGALGRAQSGPPTPAKQTARVHSTSSATDPGDRKFQANCSRCHTAPEQLSPRTTGTILLHMRVRASLSAQDERDILRYLAP